MQVTDCLFARACDGDGDEWCLCLQHGEGEMSLLFTCVLGVCYLCVSM